MVLETLWEMPKSISDLLDDALTLIGLTEVKVDLANFDLKLQENLLST
jgi:hypothetical protein